jgi:hypothetical protein
MTPHHAYPTGTFPEDSVAMPKPKTTKIMLTVSAIRMLRPDKERREVRDTGGQGHYLTIEPTGAKSFAMRFRRPNGRSARLVLGPVDFSTREPEGQPALEMIGTPLTLATSRALVHRFQSSNHIRRPCRVYRTKCGRRGVG